MGKVQLCAASLGASLVVIAGGCSGGEVHRVNKTGCRSGLPMPLRAHEVARVLRSKGFKVAPIRQLPGCDPTVSRDEQIMAILNNEAPGRFDQVLGTTGIVECTVYKGPIYSDELGRDENAASASPVFSGRKALFWVKNVECLLYAGGKEPVRQIARLRDGMEEVARLRA